MAQYFFVGFAFEFGVVDFFSRYSVLAALARFIHEVGRGCVLLRLDGLFSCNTGRGWLAKPVWDDVDEVRDTSMRLAGTLRREGKGHVMWSGSVG